MTSDVKASARTMNIQWKAAFPLLDFEYLCVHMQYQSKVILYGNFPVPLDDFKKKEERKKKRERGERERERREENERERKRKRKTTAEKDQRQEP